MALKNSISPRLSSLNSNLKVVATPIVNLVKKEKYVCVCCDLVGSSKYIREDNDEITNIEDVAKLISLTNSKLDNVFKRFCNSCVTTGDGYLGVIRATEYKNGMKLLYEISKIESSIQEYVSTSKLDINGNKVMFGVAIDVSPIIAFHDEKHYIGRAVNRASKFASKHNRNNIKADYAITTTRFKDFMKTHEVTLKNKYDKVDGVNAYTINQSDYNTIMGDEHYES